MLLALVSCERNEGLHPADPGPEVKAESRAPAQTTLDQGQSTDTPGKVGDAAMLIEKKPPVAEPAPRQPGKVISPFNGQLVDVSGIPAGTLVADPTYPPEAKKHFRVPEEEDKTGKIPPILDPSILIRPKEPPKENGNSGKEE